MSIGIKPFAIAAAATFSFGAMSVAGAQTVTLKFSHFLSVNSAFQKKVADPWCAAINKESGDRLKCQMYPSMTLGGTPAQLADQVKNGVADIVWTVPSYNTGRFPRTEAMELPFTLPLGGLTGARAMWDFTLKNAMEDYKDYKLLAVFSTTDLVLSTVDKPVTTVEDMKGLRVRSPSRVGSAFLSAMGAIPVNMPVNLITESISKGVIDGALAPWELLPPIKMDEVTKHHLEGDPKHRAMTLTPVVILMNKAKYEKLSPELRAVIDKHSGLALVEMAGRAWDSSNAEARKAILARGNKIAVIRGADYAVMEPATKKIEDDWIKQADEKGLDGARLVSELRAFGTQHASQ